MQVYQAKVVAIWSMQSLVLRSMQVHQIVVVHEMWLFRWSQWQHMKHYLSQHVLEPKFPSTDALQIQSLLEFQKVFMGHVIGCMFQTLVHKFKSMLLKAYTRSKVPITYYVTINWDEAHGWGLFLLPIFFIKSCNQFK
jgi:hypothetical protein